MSPDRNFTNGGGAHAEWLREQRRIEAEAGGEDLERARAVRWAAASSQLLSMFVLDAEEVRNGT